MFRLQRFEKTNEMLLNCNALSQSRLKIASDDFKKHTKLLNEMKKDLDYIFKKVRNIKSKLSTQYPQPFAEAAAKNKPVSFDEEDEIDTARRAETLDEGNPSRTATPVKQQASAGGVKQQLPKQMMEKEKKKLIGGAGQMDPETTTVSYMKMEQSPENRKSGKASPIDPKRSSLLSTQSSSTDNSNDSSECTSDTG